MNQEHHAEQMDAARRDFDEFWKTKLLPILFTGKVDERTTDSDFGFIHTVCWRAFQYGINKGKNP